MDELTLCYALCTVLIIIVILILLQSRKARCPCGCLPSECTCPISCPGCTCASENFKALKDIPPHKQRVVHVKRAKRRSKENFGDADEDEDESGYYPYGVVHYNHAKSGLPDMTRPEYHRAHSTINEGGRVQTPFDEMYGDVAYQDPGVQEAVMEGQPDKSLVESAEPFHVRSRSWGPSRYHHARRGWHGGGYWHGLGYAPVPFPLVIDDDSMYSYVQARGYVEHQRAYDPSPQDDIRSGHQRGHVWRNIRSQKLFVLTDASPNYAKWMPVQEVAPMTDRVAPSRALGQQKAIPRGGAKQYLSCQSSDYRQAGLSEKTNALKADTDTSKKQGPHIMNLVQPTE